MSRKPQSDDHTEEPPIPVCSRTPVYTRTTVSIHLSQPAQPSLPPDPVQASNIIDKFMSIIKQNREDLILKVDNLVHLKMDNSPMYASPEG